MIGAQTFTINDETELSFALEIDTSLQLHTWTTEVNNTWINLIGKVIYEFLRESTLVFNKNIANPIKYSADASLKEFREIRLNTEMGSLQNVVEKLYNKSLREANNNVDYIIVSLYSDSTSDTILISVERMNDKISFGACLQGSEL